MQKSGTLVTNILLGILVCFAALRLAGFFVVFGEESLQMDFSAFYTAGEASNAGLWPYENHFPEIWDGVCWYRHSRFLYPPLVAVLFRPIASIPYHAAKYIWMIFGLACVTVSILLSFKAIGKELGLTPKLAVALFVLFFHPLLVMMERGQIDGVTLLLTTAAFYLLCHHRRAFLSGLLLSLACLLKLHTVYIVPFLLLRQKWRVLLGFGAGGALLLLLTVGYFGTSGLVSYATVELPRIAQHGEEGPRDMYLQPDIKKMLPRPDRATLKDGRHYPPQALRFNPSACIARTPFGEMVGDAVSSLGMTPSISSISLTILGGFFALFFAWEAITRFSWRPDNREEFVYWLLVLVIVLLSGPLTWVMNAVWLIPLAVFVLSEWRRTDSRGQAVGLAVLGTGLLWMAMPDHKGFPVPAPFDWTKDVVLSENVLAKILVALGLMIYIVARYDFASSPAPSEPSRPDA